MEAIGELGGSILYDYEWSYYQQLPPLPRPVGPKSPWPLWLRQSVGDDFLHRVVAVDLELPLVYLITMERREEDAITERDLAVLGGFPNLQRIILRCQPLGGSAVRELMRYPELREVYLEETLIADADLIHLAKLPRLSELSLIATGIGDAGLEHIAGMTSLRRLWLCFTRATPEGVEKLREALPECEIIYEDEGRCRY